MSCNEVRTQRLGCAEDVKFCASINLLKAETCEDYPDIQADVRSF